MLIVTGIIATTFSTSRKINNTVFDLFYDAEFLYLKSNREIKIIKLQRIKSIESLAIRTQLIGFPFYKYQITYTAQYSAEENIKFWYGIKDTKLNDFKKIWGSKIEKRNLNQLSK